MNQKIKKINPVRYLQINLAGIIIYASREK